MLESRARSCVLFAGCVLLLAIQGINAACPARRFQLISGHSACLPRSQYAQNSGVTDAEKQEIVDRHNYLRANVNPTATDMLKMSWDAEVALVAQTYAENCVFDHDESMHRIIPGQYSAGQNLALASSGATHNWTNRINAWYSEVSRFEYGTGSTTGEAVGHFTQVVWAKTHKIGCGYCYCSNLYSGSGGHLYVCNYSPAGNESPGTSTPYTSGTSCGGCPNSCSSKLCDCSSRQCYNDGTLNIDTCECTCNNNEPFYVGSSCVLNCTGIGTPSCRWSDSSYCSRYSNVPFDCPVFCGWCPDADSTGADTGEPTTTPGTDGGGGADCLKTNVYFIFMLLLLIFALV